MKDRKGRVMELLQGNWHPHVAVEWWEDESGNYIEFVGRKMCK